MPKYARIFVVLVTEGEYIQDLLLKKVNGSRILSGVSYPLLSVVRFFTTNPLI